jgi:hypothetical protein
VVESNSLQCSATERLFPRLLRRTGSPGALRVARMTRLLRLAAALLVGLGLAAGEAPAQTQVDLELVIAVDVSLSMDLDEQRLQRDGYVAAFRDGDVHKAIASGAFGRIAVTYVEWAGPPSQHVVLPWTVVDGPESARAVAGRLEAAPITRARMTSISSVLDFSGGLFDSSGVRGVRRVVDVSGDGPNNAGRPVIRARNDLLAKGIVINGLPVMLKLATGYFDISDLDRYYADCVIGGPGSFMIPIKNRREFLTATRRKLLLEISGLEPPARLIRVQGPSMWDASDCNIGELQWRRFLEDGGPN